MRFAILTITAAALLFTGLGFAAKDAAPPTDARPIKEVMGEVMKSGLVKKVTGETATDEEKLKFLDYIVDLTENEPPQGDAEAWTAKTNKILALTAKVIVGREGAAKELGAETNCAKCHNQFKPD